MDAFIHLGLKIHKLNVAQFNFNLGFNFILRVYSLYFFKLPFVGNTIFLHVALELRNV